MERILTSAEMKNADKYTIENLGVPSDVLVERAGEAVAEEIIRRKKGGRVLVVCGRGNNGADGKVIAKTLSSHHGFSVKIYDVCADDISVLDGDYDIIVDCLFGTGLNRKVDGEYKTVIDKINGKGKYVVSCDIPSGLNADTGVPMGVAVKANLTVAVQEYKTGHFFNDGFDYSGETVAKDIGISIWGEDFSYRLTKEDVCAYFPKRNRNSNKGDYKKACVIGGSESFYGAPLLSSLSLTSLVGGAGYAYLGVPESRYSLYAGINPECIVLPFNGADADKFFFADSIAVGMGMGDSEETYSFVRSLIRNYTGKLIIDADGLNSLAKFGVDVLKERKCEILLTPHVKEFSRLSGVSVENIKSNPVKHAKDFALNYGVTVLLKDAASVITDGKRVCINTTGSPALAKGGSGDILSGLIVGLAVRENLFDSACVGSYILGKAGELSAKETGVYSTTPTDVIKQIQNVIKGLEG